MSMSAGTEETTRMNPRLRIAILVSGRGSNLSSILREQRDGRLRTIEVAAVISNNPDVPALRIAQEFGIEALVIDHREFGKERSKHDAAILAALQQRNVRAVVLAGYMRLLTPTLISAYPNRIVNIHPSLLPSYPGMNAQKQAIENGARVSGCTVHFVTEKTDGGPIILQKAVPVHQNDTEDELSHRILMEEHRLLPFALDLLSSHRLTVKDGRVHIAHGTSDYPEMEELIAPRMPLLLATGNVDKARELEWMLSAYGFKLQTTEDFRGMTEPEETADDYLGNARIKARVWQTRTGMWVLADDSGIELEALGGRPGVKSSRYAPTSEARNQKLLKELAEVPTEKRRARMVSTVVLAGPNGAEYHATGICSGFFGFEPRGIHGFGYDPYFIPDGHNGRHFAEIDEVTKNRSSHRARAIEGLREVLTRLSEGKL